LLSVKLTEAAADLTLLILAGLDAQPGRQRR
jgi:hypothetical protein